MKKDKLDLTRTRLTMSGWAKLQRVRAYLRKQADIHNDVDLWMWYNRGASGITDHLVYEHTRNLFYNLRKPRK